MSSLATNAIIDASGGNTATINSYTPTESNMAGRNRIINGAMVIDQRNAGASVTATLGVVGYPVDRWALNVSASSKFTAQQSSAFVGFSNSLLITSSSAYSITSGDYFLVEQNIEGFNVADLGWGTANASAVTLSFKAKSSLTGTFGGVISNSALNRSYPFTYSIPVANTETTISITIPGDTSGTWLTTNGIGIRVRFSMGTGSTYSGTAGAWSGSTYVSATGATSVVGTSGATFYITGVQLEAGSVATPFQRRQYGQELALCQRYYAKYSVTNIPQQSLGLGFQMAALTTSQITTYPKVTMRALPTMGFANLGVSDYTSWGGEVSSISGQLSTANVCQFQVTHNSGGVSFRPTLLYGTSASASYLDMSAEL
jgi:hypothetical protein